MNTASTTASATQEKPRQNWAGLWNISFGFFGIQIGFALQNANMSRVFQSLGSAIDDLPALWVAAPLTGLLVQPIIGHLSDKTWLGKLGRRRPYFLLGAVLAGSVFGDHCSPISDTTILSSTGARCHHIDHVATQLPYALAVALVSAIGYVVLGIFASLGLALAAASVCFVVVCLIFAALSKAKVSKQVSA